MAKPKEREAPPEGKAYFRLFYAAAGPCPAAFPAEWTPESTQRWAVECQLRFAESRPVYGGMRNLLTKSAMRLWLNREYGYKLAREIVTMIREFPE